MALLKTLLILLLVYYLVKILAKFFAPKLFAFAARKAESHLKKKFEQFTEDKHTGNRQQEDIIVDKKDMNKRKPSKKVGDYIDFEEIE